MGSKKKGVGSLIFGEQIYLLFLQHAWLLKVSCLKPLKLLKQVSNYTTILFGSMLPRSSKWVVGFHVDGGVIYVKMTRPIRDPTQESRLTFYIRGKGC